MGDTFDNFDVKKNPGMKAAMAICEAVALKKRPSALLVGDYGTGKSHLAIAALNAFDGGGYFWKVPEFLAYLRRKQFEPGGIDAEIAELQTDTWPALYAETTGGRLTVREAIHFDRLIVFDDLGAENQTDWAGEQLYRVLDGRYDNRLPTIITSNTDMSRLDGRLLSRFSEGMVACKGSDVRRAK